MNGVSFVGVGVVTAEVESKFWWVKLAGRGRRKMQRARARSVLINPVFVSILERWKSHAMPRNARRSYGTDGQTDDGDEEIYEGGEQSGASTRVTLS